MSAQRYVLDTSVFVHFVRGSLLWERVLRDTYQLLTTTPTPRYCVVSEGEIRSLALRWDWGNRKLEQMEFCLSFFEPHPIEHPAVMRSYAVLDAHCAGTGHKMGKNDLWIAATASALGATLLTMDRDFDRLSPQFLSRIWIDPDTR